MRKIIGAASILLACFLAALGRLRSKKERIHLLQTLAQSLQELCGTLSEQQKGLGGLFSALARKSGNEAVSGFYEALNRKMRDLGSGARRSTNALRRSEKSSAACSARWANCWAAASWKGNAGRLTEPRGRSGSLPRRRERPWAAR